MEKQELIKKIIEKKEFQELPLSVIERVLEIKEIKNQSGEQKIKDVRAFLRKYFSVFMTNKLISGRLNDSEILKKHISTKNRNYKELYKKITLGGETIIDLGAGMNGFSYEYFPQKVRYLAIEAIRVFVNLMNNYFKSNNFDAKAIQLDLFEVEKLSEIISKQKGKKTILMLNLIDALEGIKRDFSKELIIKLAPLAEKVVISFPTQSLTGKAKFKAKRYWFENFVTQMNWKILNDFEEGGERYFIIKCI